VILGKRIRRQQEKVKKDVQKKIDKQERKLKKLKTELADTAQEQLWKRRADLLKVNMRQLKPGMEFVLVKDYFSTEQNDIKIPVRNDLSAQQNVNLLYKKYKKARDGKAKIREQITITENEINALQEEMRKVLEIDILADKVTETPATEKRSSSLRRLEVNDDWEILIGRTSLENDLLTTRFAKPDDWWFHTRIFRGTHVVLRNFHKKTALPEGLLIICCRLAAYFSKAKKSSNVPVDYTRIRYVRKPRKSPPGFVVYTDQKTIYVDPLSMREAKLEIKQWKRE
jgi:predicted ribosome quality control (RQC) complex YloA/Tae2 family protein